MRAPAQYGPALLARSAYLNLYQLLPVARTAEALRDLFGCAISPATVDRELALLSRIFTRAMKEKVAAVNPCSEVKRLRAHLLPAVLVAVGMGMRRGDQLSLHWERVDFQRNVIWVPNAKTGQSYPVPMSAQAREIMLELRRAARGSDYVFANPKTGRPYTELRRPFATACRDAGIRGLRWHDLRHTFGTRLAEAGHSEATIAELLGHSDPKTTRRYTHGTERAKRAAVEAASMRAQGWGEQLADLKMVAK